MSIYMNVLVVNLPYYSEFNNVGFYALPGAPNKGAILFHNAPAALFHAPPPLRSSGDARNMTPPNTS